jgi:hypothetical protein
LQYIYNGIVEVSKKMHIKRKLLAIIICVVMAVTPACSPPPEGGPLRVLESAAVAMLEGVRHGVEFSAKLSQSALDADGMREARLEFTAPEALAGICVEYACGVFGASLGEVSLSGLAAEKLGAPIVAFLPAGEVIVVEKMTGEDGTAQTRIKLQRGLSFYEYVIDSKSGLPLSVSETSAEGETIMKIKIMEYETE